jgi:hypothetical protein
VYGASGTPLVVGRTGADVVASSHARVSACGRCGPISERPVASADISFSIAGAYFLPPAGSSGLARGGPAACPRTGGPSAPRGGRSRPIWAQARRPTGPNRIACTPGGGVRLGALCSPGVRTGMRRGDRLLGPSSHGTAELGRFTDGHALPYSSTTLIDSTSSSENRRTSPSAVSILYPSRVFLMSSFEST